VCGKRLNAWRFTVDENEFLSRHMTEKREATVRGCGEEQAVFNVSTGILAGFFHGNENFLQKKPRLSTF
jgi:hypothetical protein